MKYAIKSRWDGSVIFEAEIECSADAREGIKLGLAVRVALKAGANLTGANLTDAYLADANLARANLARADLTDANLTGANLAGANLARADLTDAYLARAYLTGANLARANLTNAYLTGANLTDANLADANLAGADLTGANLARADLTDANLTRADLTDANLARANLTGADLRAFKADMWLTLAQNRPEVPGIIKALREGRVDGSQYEGECACLVGTVAKIKGVNFADIEHNSENPAERWFMMISKGDKPGDDTGGGFAAKKALEWAEEFCDLHGIAYELELEDENRRLRSIVADFSAIYSDVWGADDKKDADVCEAFERVVVSIRSRLQPAAAVEAPGAEAGKAVAEKLGRFGHHPEPATDFCLEVDDIEAEAVNIRVYELGPAAWAELADRIDRAMDFRVGGDADAVAAKDKLREIEKSIPASPTALPAPEGALESLRTYQKQLDRDGVFVGVSRQALEEVLDWALQASPHAGDDK